MLWYFMHIYVCFFISRVNVMLMNEDARSGFIKNIMIILTHYAVDAKLIDNGNNPQQTPLWISGEDLRVTEDLMRETRAVSRTGTLWRASETLVSGFMSLDLSGALQSRFPLRIDCYIHTSISISITVSVKLHWAMTQTSDIL